MINNLRSTDTQQTTNYLRSTDTQQMTNNLLSTEWYTLKHSGRVTTLAYANYYGPGTETFKM